MPYSNVVQVASSIYRDLVYVNTELIKDPPQLVRTLV